MAKTRIACLSRTTTEFVPVADIQAVKADSKLYALHTPGGVFYADADADLLRRTLGKWFIEIHRGVHVRLRSVNRIRLEGEQWIVRLDVGIEFPVSRRKAPEVRAALKREFSLHPRDNR